jgi:hypothetical protein
MKRAWMGFLKRNGTSQGGGASRDPAPSPLICMATGRNLKKTATDVVFTRHRMCSCDR